MKRLFSTVIVACLLWGCKKENPPPALSPRAELLTAHAWLYAEYYTGYGTSAQKRVYKRGAPGNVVDFSDYRYVFKKDGAFELFLKRETIKGGWKLISNEQQVELSFPGSTPTVMTVAALSADSFDWVQDDYFARMIPQ